jgi:hypothetical protein
MCAVRIQTDWYFKMNIIHHQLASFNMHSTMSNISAIFCTIQSKSRIRNGSFIDLWAVQHTAVTGF